MLFLPRFQKYVMAYVQKCLLCLSSCKLFRITQRSGFLLFQNIKQTFIENTSLHHHFMRLNVERNCGIQDFWFTQNRNKWQR